MKEELRQLYREYEEECERLTGENEWWYQPTVEGYWKWLLTRKIEN